MSAAKATSGNLFADDPAFQVTAQTISVLPPLPLAGPYDYLVPEGISVQPGDFVEIPLGRQTQRGVVWGDAKGDVDFEQASRDLWRPSGRADGRCHPQVR
ncbi:MAG: hypothetical protein ACFHHU_17480 [Porticoccaceae bacterium]